MLLAKPKIWQNRKFRVWGLGNVLDLGEDLIQNDGPDEPDHAERPRTITPPGDFNQGHSLCATLLGEGLQRLCIPQNVSRHAQAGR